MRYYPSYPLPGRAHRAIGSLAYLPRIRPRFSPDPLETGAVVYYSEVMDGCPHCGRLLNLGHVCADKDRWARDERDRLREIMRKRYPAIRYVSTFQSERMGHR